MATALWVEDVPLRQVASRLPDEPTPTEAMFRLMLDNDPMLQLGDVVGFVDDDGDGVHDPEEQPTAMAGVILAMSDEQMAEALHSFQIGLDLGAAEIGPLIRTLIDTKPATQEAAIAPWVPLYDMVGFSSFPNYYSPLLEAGADGAMVGHMAGRLIQAFPDTPVLVMTTGYPSGPEGRGFSEELQATFVEEMLTSCFAAGVSGIIWERLLSPDSTTWPDEHPWAVEGFWGLGRTDDSGAWEEKPAWALFSEQIAQGPKADDDDDSGDDDDDSGGDLDDDDSRPTETPDSAAGCAECSASPTAGLARGTPSWLTGFMVLGVRRRSRRHR